MSKVELQSPGKKKTLPELHTLDENELRQVTGGDQTTPPPDPNPPTDPNNGGKRIGSLWP
jgi:bacteriocin-like protein